MIKYLYHDLLLGVYIHEGDQLLGSGPELLQSHSLLGILIFVSLELKEKIKRFKSSRVIDHLDVVCEAIQAPDVVISCDPLNNGLKPGPGLGVPAVDVVPDLVVVALRLGHLLLLHRGDLLAGRLHGLGNIVRLGETQGRLL